MKFIHHLRTMDALTEADPLGDLVRKTFRSVRGGIDHQRQFGVCRLV